MNRPGWVQHFATLVSSFFLGALWGSASAILESLFFSHAFHVGLQNPRALFELVLNYAIYAGAAWVGLRLVLEALSRRPAPRAGADPAASPGGASRFRDAARLTEAIGGSILFAGAVAGYFQKGPWGLLPITSPAGLGITGAGVVLVVILALCIRRMGPRAVRILRFALAVWVAVGFLWYPLFGPFAGILRGHDAKAQAGPAMNILLIIVDTLRADYLGSYGATWGASPVADRLAAEGTLFENQLGQSTWTLPGTATILTGLHPSSHGAVATGLGLASTARTLSEVLQDAGYRTGAFTENTYIRPQTNFGRGFDHFWTYWLPWVYDYTFLYRVLPRLHMPTIKITNRHAYVTIPDISTPDEVNWDARAATDAALKWLRAGGDAPFFAYVHYMQPHSPYGPREYLLAGDPPSKRLTDYPRPMGGAFPLGGSAGRATDREIEEMKTLYAAGIRYVDYHIGRIVDWLEETGKLSQTLIVLTSDHGEEFLEHGSWNHGSSAFNEVLRTPLILYGERIVPKGKRIRAVSRQIDVMPTILDLVGLECPSEIQGRSLRALLEGAPLDPAPAYVEVYPAEPKESDIFALVEGRHKIVRVSVGSRSTVLLYDLEADPQETNNLADNAPALRDSLLLQMDKWDRSVRRNSPLDLKRLKYFRSLSYINQ